jgi:tetratricopeptide (TPR) repeat protein
LLAAGAQPAEVGYLETLVPSLDYGWSDLRGVRARGWKYIRAPRPELYRLSEDPAETTNVFGDYPEIERRLGDWLEYYLAREEIAGGGEEDLDPETLERLRSLGYLQAGGGRAAYTGADPKDRIETYKAITAAMTAISEYRPGDAIKILEPVVRQERRNLELMLSYASAHAMAGDLEKARSLYQALLQERPEDPRLIRRMLDLAMLGKDSERAWELLGRLRRLQPEEPGLDSLRGQLLEMDGRTAEARAAYQAEIEAHPDQYEAYTLLAALERKQNHADRAESLLLKSIGIFPGFAPALSELADMRYEQGRMSEGDSILAEALAADPNEPLANFRKGWRAKEANNLLSARRHYQMAIKVRPEFPVAHFNLGNVYLESGDWQRALRHYVAALDLGYESALLRTNQGVALASRGRLAEAVEVWERALQLGPDEELRRGIEQNLELARGRMGR